MVASNERFLTRLRKVIDLLPAGTRRRSLLLLFLFFITALSELLSVSSVLPLVATASDPQQNPWLARFGVSDPRQLVTAFGLVFIALYVLATMLNAVTWWYCLELSADVSHHLSTRLLSQYLHRPHAWFFSRNTTELLRRVLDDTARVVDHVVLPLMRGGSQCLSALFICAGLLYIEPVVAVVSALTITVLYSLTYRFFVGRIERLGRRANDLNAQRYKLADESLTAFKSARIGPRRRAFIDRFAASSREYLDAGIYHRTIADLPRYVTEVLAIATIIMVFIYLAWSGHSTPDSISLVCLYIMAVWRVVPALQRVYSNAVEIGFHMRGLDLVRDELLDVAALVPETDGPRLELTRAVTLRGVSFAYTADVPAVSEIDLEIPRGTAIALVGRTGCGKSTLADLVTGYLVPTAGTIEIDGTPLQGEVVPSWQRNVGYVPQDIFLIDDSVTRNVALGIPDDQIDAAAVERACRQARIHDFICTLEGRYDAILGERGALVSGGQRQRIGIARALYGDPQMLVLDEATSALDNQTESEVMDAIAALAGQKTLLVIAHRLSTVEACDRIVLIDDGRIVDQGPYARVLAASPLLQQLARRTEEAGARS